MEVRREVLLKAIKAVLPAMARRETFDQANLLAVVSGKMVAFDDRVMIAHPLPGDLDLEGTVDGRKLAELLDKLKVEIVNLAVDNGKLILRAGRSRTSFDVLPTTLPVDQVDAETGEMVDLPDGFADQVRWASTSCAKSLDRPALNCVLVSGGWVQAADGYRASRARHGDADLPRLMLPLAQVGVLVDYPIRRVALSDGGEWARFEAEGETALCARSTSGEYPDLAKVYAVEGAEVQLTAALSEALERAGIFAHRAAQEDEEVRVSMRPNQVTVAAKCDGAEFSEVVRCEGAAEGVEFSIHPRLLAEALGSGTRCVVGERSVKFSGEDWEHVIARK